MELNSNQPLVSVLMTAYNREKYIKEAIESVLASTYQHLELIVVDDCSSDQTLTIAEEFAKKDQRVRVYRNEQRLGQFQNRNRAATYAKGKYIKYFDSDDILYAHSLVLMVNIMEQFPECAIGLAYTKEKSPFPFPHKYEPVEAYREHYFDGGFLFMGPGGLIIRTEVFNEVGGFHYYGMPSDNHFTLRVAALYPVVTFYADLFWWRVHENQAYAIGHADCNNISDSFRFNIDILTRKECPLTDGEKQRLIKLFTTNFSRNTLRYLYQHPTEFKNVNKMLHAQQISWFKLLLHVV